jgi:hypothetical protein
MPIFFLYEKKSNVQHLIKISFKISTNKLQERTKSDFHQITRPYPNSKNIIRKHYELKWCKNRTLWYSTSDGSSKRINTVKPHKLLTISQIWPQQFISLLRVFIRNLHFTKQLKSEFASKPWRKIQKNQYSNLWFDPNGAVVMTTDCEPRGSGFESRVRYGFSVKVWIFLTFFRFRRTIKFDTHKPEGMTDSNYVWSYCYSWG